ncbi:hypothetical protein OESDEN_13364 [Oesophagostomum dentatum]|uniref:Uncharacterized protein n=1 Tax=Oesophagostomum dentatum TaxID=61180 RepID=A0A0B1STK8_OESDE|nr:hypothetical protein OESDEN_13364 [Oesophagostomum dentatum]
MLHPRCQLVKIIELQPESHQRQSEISMGNENMCSCLASSSMNCPFRVELANPLQTILRWKTPALSSTYVPEICGLGAKHNWRMGPHRLHVVKKGGFFADAYEDGEDDSESSSHR